MKYKLSEIGEIVSGGTPSTKINDYWNGDVAWITPKDLANYNKKYISRGERNISKLGLDSSSATLLPVNTVLFTSRAPIGYVAIAKNELATNQGFKSIICDKNKCNYRYMYYWLKFNTQKIIEKANGSTFLEISGASMKNIEIDLPLLEEQNKIIKILETIDSKIELNDEINDNLQMFINNLFIEFFIDIKPEKNEMKTTELGNIPVDWNIGILSDIVEFSNGYGFDSKKMLDEEIDSSYKVFKMGNINIGGGINKTKTKSWMKYEDCVGLDRFIAKKGDILMCMTDMKNSGNPLLGHTALIDKDNEFVINQRVGLLRCNKGISYAYVYTLSNLDFFISDIRSRANSGVQVNLTTKGICETKVIIPDSEVLKKFENIVNPIYEKKFNILQENEELLQLRETLLPKLMNGEIDLDKIEI